MTLDVGSKFFIKKKNICESFNTVNTYVAESMAGRRFIRRSVINHFLFISQKQAHDSKRNRTVRHNRNTC